jgi:hypothetical protein
VGKWHVKKRDRLGPGQLWMSHEGGQRLIVKIENDRVWFWTLAFPAHREAKYRRPYGYVSLDRFVIWSSRLLQSELDYRDYKYRMEVVNAREENRRAG